MSVAMIGLVSAFVLVLVVLIYARRQTSPGRDANHGGSWYSDGGGTSKSTDSSCDSGTSDGGCGSDGGGGGD